MIERIKKLLEIEKLSATQFADEINLQRSSLSHVLSGRNKPSLDFVMKVKNRFTEISLDWLIFGTGSMFISPVAKKENENTDIEVEQKKSKNPQAELNFDISSQANDTKQTEPTFKPTENKSKVVQNSSSLANKVIIFYNDGTFEQYNQK